MDKKQKPGVELVTPEDVSAWEIPSPAEGCSYYIDGDGILTAAVDGRPIARWAGVTRHGQACWKYFETDNVKETTTVVHGT